MDRFPQRPPRGPEPLLADRLIIDLDGYDIGFNKRVCDIFEIDYYMDGRDSRLLRDWIEFSVNDIISLFSMNPSTLFGTINIGPDFKKLHEMGMDPKRFDNATQELFSEAYKLFATNIYHVLARKLGNLLSKAIDMGFADISCTVHRYKPGLVVLNVNAMSETDY